MAGSGGPRGDILIVMVRLYKMDSNLIRVVVVFLGIATGGLPLLVAYIVGWIIIPPRPAPPVHG